MTSSPHMRDHLRVCTDDESKPACEVPCPDQTMTLVLETYLVDLRKFALKLCGRPDLAADVVQQACMKAWKARKTYQASHPPKPWLFRIVKNEFLQIVRKKTLLTNVNDNVFDTAGKIVYIEHNTLDILSLKRKLTSLPAEQREAVTLVLAMGMTYEEAGDMCACPAGTIKSRVNRGRLKLRQAMQLEDVVEENPLPLAS